MTPFPRIDVYRWQEQNGLIVRNVVEIHVDGARIGGLQGYSVEEHYNTVGKATLHLQGELMFHEGKPGGEAQEDINLSFPPAPTQAQFDRAMAILQARSERMRARREQDD